MATEYNQTLGICIPTYKRPDQLYACVKSIITSAEPFRVPIIISDDSTDATNESVIRQLEELYPYIIYSKNQTNLGIDGNILHSTDICPCDYAWLLGEDDRMSRDAIKTILDYIASSSEPVPFIASNYSYVDEHIRTVLRPRVIPLKSNSVMEAEPFLRSFSWSIGFIGGCVIRKSLWEKIDSSVYVGTFFAHVGTIMEYMAGRSFHIIAQPLILNRSGDASVFTWSGDTYGVLGGWARMCELLKKIYPAESCDDAAKAFSQSYKLDSIRFLSAKRADNVYNISIYQTKIRSGNYSPLYKGTALLIALADARVFRALRWMLNTKRRLCNPPVQL